MSRVTCINVCQHNAGRKHLKTEKELYSISCNTSVIILCTSVLIFLSGCPASAISLKSTQYSLNYKKWQQHFITNFVYFQNYLMPIYRYTRVRLNWVWKDTIVVFKGFTNLWEIIHTQKI